MEKMQTPLSSSFLLLSFLFWPSSCSPGLDFHDFYSAHPRFLCTPVPLDADPSCFPAAGVGGAAHQGPPPAGWLGAGEEAKNTILHLRENLVRQKETILDQRETIRELTAKLAMCEGLGRTPHDDRSSDHAKHYNWGHHYGTLTPDPPSDGVHREKDVKHETSRSPEQMESMLQALKERLDNLQKRNSSLTYSSALRQLLQRKIHTLEEQLHQRTGALGDQLHHDDHDDQRHIDDHDDRHDLHHDDDPNGRTDDSDQGDHGDHEDHGDHGDHGDHDTGQHLDEHSDGRHDGDNEDTDDGHQGNEADSHTFVPHPESSEASQQGGYHNQLDTMLQQLHLQGSSSRENFQISFPMRTNFMFGKMKKTILQEIFAFTLCLWIKNGVGVAMGTPLSYSAPGQPNELVLIEWGGNPIELLIDDQVTSLPWSLGDAKWHHVCVSWSTRDGGWEAYQDGVQRGSGTGLAPWHAIKSGGVFILGQEQDTLGGRFDAAQSFVGEMADVQMWSRVLSAAEIHHLASCGGRPTGDVLAWSEAQVELHGGALKHAMEPCR
ncbi:neuronal pentraxin-1 isoform X2 [Nerophis ophidion]|uniref:neuronal pentraxin-1 isoform X2 n=1 Tax=Nerophis ophidion TaxID=159077 RepID=UPI002ADF69F7|nr:neuronal pentraxin-1 isoform X2 [Nerophis ophidion]